MKLPKDPFPKRQSHDVLLWPNHQAYKDCLDYFLSQKITGVKVPLPDVRPESPMEIFVMNRQIFKDTCMLLVQKRVEYSERRKEMRLQWIDLEKKEKSLQNAFIKFNKFVAQNAIKSQRSEAAYLPNKMAAEHAATLIEDTKRRLKSIKITISRLQNELIKHKIYEDYLSDVCWKSHSFKSVKDILDLFEILHSQRAFIMEMDQKVMAQLDAAIIQLAEKKAEYSNNIMQLKSVLGNLEIQYEEIKHKASQMDCRIHIIKSTILANEITTSRTKLAIWQFYLTICNLMQEKPKYSKTSFENILVYIKKTFKMQLKRSRMSTAHKKNKYTKMSQISQPFSMSMSDLLK